VDPTLAKLTLWHGFTPVLALSAATLLAGIGIFAIRGKLSFAARLLEKIDRFTPTAIYQSGLDGLLKAADFLTGWIQRGQLRVYVRITLVAASGLILYATALSVGEFSMTSRVPLGFFETSVVVLMSVSAVAASARAAVWPRFSASAGSAIRWRFCSSLTARRTWRSPSCWWRR
jgi:multicomponent Na+:H+ antiporter subunit A